jgi:phospholipase/carboxylesterase
MATTETVEIETGSAPAGSVIWLHGLGADGHDFEPIVAELHLPPELALRFVFPHAPLRPVTINAGMSMRAWYDILGLDRSAPADEAGIRDSARILDTLVARESRRGIEDRNIVVAGFSQGGAIALHAGLRHPGELAGVMALSTYLPLAEYFADEVLGQAQRRHRDMPIFMAHGRFDPVLPYELGRASADLLVDNGYQVEWHEYPMAHAVCAEEVADIRRWLLSVFAAAERET